MALIQMGAIVTRIKGSVGGTTFSTARGGFVMKNKKTGPSGIKTGDGFINYKMAQLINVWQAMTSGDRASFASPPRFKPGSDLNGNPRTYSAYEWFLSYNFYRVSSGLLPVQTNPFTHTTNALPVITLSNMAGHFYVIADYLFSKNDFFVIILISMPQSPTRSMSSARLKFCPLDCSIDWDTQDITTWYQNQGCVLSGANNLIRYQYKVFDHSCSLLFNSQIQETII